MGCWGKDLIINCQLLTVNGGMGGWLHGYMNAWGGGAGHGFNDYGRGDLAPTLTKNLL